MAGLGEPVHLIDLINGMQHFALLAFLGAASYCDLRTGKIPNPLNLAGALVGLGLVAAQLRFDLDAGGFLLGGLIASAALLLLYLGGGVGGGDVKLAVGFGLLSGYPEVVRYLFYGGLAALILILARLTWRDDLIGGLRRSVSRPVGVSAPGEAAEEAARPERAGASFSFPAALLAGVLWVWAMRTFA